MRVSRGASRPRSDALISDALSECRRAFGVGILVTATINLLMFAGPLYMLQVYDRVIASRSVPTLVAVTAMLVFAMALQGLLDAVRARVLVRIGRLLDERLAGPVHAAVVRTARTATTGSAPTEPIRDLDQIRAFLSSPGPGAIADLPWIVVFVGACVLIHPWIGLLASAGAIVLIAVTWQTEVRSRGAQIEALGTGARRLQMVDDLRRQSETVTAMGMEPALRRRYRDVNRRALDAAQAAADVIGTFGAAARSFRLLLQSLVLGLGAYLVLQDQMSAGAMIAASILVGRALAPIDAAIANWRALIAATEATRRLRALLVAPRADAPQTRLPAPVARLDVEGLAVAAPNADTPTLVNVSFGLRAGQAMGVIGPSAVGKSSLMKVLVGAWPPARGAVRLDGAELSQWRTEDLGPHVGYLPQDVVLFDGTIAENIARMAHDAPSERVVEAAREAGAHEMILRLPNGYDTRIGEQGTALSGGQRQRVALARALYGAPFLIVLDEPGSNLDNEGDVALNAAILAVKRRGGVVVVVVHRPSGLVACDTVLHLGNGGMLAFGPKKAVLARLVPPAAPGGTDAEAAERAPA